MNIVAIIPARGNSKGIKKKNIIDFCGKPLIAWTILQAKKSKHISDVYVSSDSDEILGVSEQFGAIGIKRPDEISTDTSTSESALVHFLETLESDGKKVDMVVFLQATSPLRETSDIDTAIEKMINEKADSLFSSARLEDFFIWGFDENGNMQSLNFDYKNRKRRQDVIPQWEENGSMYLFKPWVLQKNDNRMGGKIAHSEMEAWKLHEIDKKEDLELCGFYFRNRLLKDYGNDDSDANSNIDLADIDVIFYDFDGVMTDNKVMVNEDGQETVSVNRSDGLAVSLLKKENIPQYIVSTEKNPVVSMRAKKLDIPVSQDVGNKAEVVNKICKENGYSIERAVFIGNDTNDLEVMQIVGYPVVPQDAHPSVKNIARIVLKTSGGEGVIREFAGLLLK